MNRYQPDSCEAKQSMSPKKTILKALSDRSGTEGTGELIRPSSIPGFEKAPDKYQKTINALLQDRLIEGMRDQDGRLAIALNPHRTREIRKELRPVWAHPALLAALALVATAVGFGFLG